MNEQQITEYFLEKINSCYFIEEDNKYHLYYDENFIRTIKLANILNTDKIPTKTNGIKLFEIDILNKIIFYDYFYFNQKYKITLINFIAINSFIRNIVRNLNKIQTFEIINDINDYKIKTLYLNIECNDCISIKLSKKNE